MAHPNTFTNAASMIAADRAADLAGGDIERGDQGFENGLLGGGLGLARGATLIERVIFAKITPCMENGKFALASALHNG